MDETSERHGQEQTEKSNDGILSVGNSPVMEIALDALTMLGDRGQVILRARGNSIPNAVAAANIITEKMLNGNSRVDNIKLDTAQEPGIGKMLSTIEIILNKV